MLRFSSSHNALIGREKNNQSISSSIGTFSGSSSHRSLNEPWIIFSCNISSFIYFSGVHSSGILLSLASHHRSCLILLMPDTLRYSIPVEVVFGFLLKFNKKNNPSLWEFHDNPVPNTDTNLGSSEFWPVR